MPASATAPAVIQVASRRTHNSVLEIAWTAIPVLILVVIAIPSFKLLYFMDRAANPEMTLKAIGHQWYWSYESGQRQLHVRCLHDRRSGPPGRSAAPARGRQPGGAAGRHGCADPDHRDDVILRAVPALGVKMDAIPGRLNETWLRIEAGHLLRPMLRAVRRLSTVTCQSRSRRWPRTPSKHGRSRPKRSSHALRRGITVADRQASE